MIRIIISLTLVLSFFQVTGQQREPTYHIAAVEHVNSELYQLVHNPTNGLVYVAGPKAGFNREVENFVYALDGNTLAVVDSISVGNYLPFGIALNNTTQTLYVGHSLQQAISAIDIRTKKQTLIPNGKERSKIREIVVDEKNNKVYVSDHGNPSIWEVDGKTNTYVRSFDYAGAYLLGLHVDSERGKVYGTDGRDMEGNVLVFDSESGVLEQKFKTWSYCPLNIALDLQGNRIFVSQSNDNNITILDGNTGEIIDKVYLGFTASPIGLVYDPVNDLIYTANRSQHEVAIIDAKNYTVLERIPTEALPNTISFDQRTGAIYVTNKTAGRNGEPVKNGNTVMKILKNKS